MLASLLIPLCALAQDPVAVALRPEAGAVWRNSLRIERGEARNSGETSFLMDLRVRWRCLEVSRGVVELEGRFVSWRLRLQDPEQRLEWHKGKMLVLNEVEDLVTQGSKALFMAWEAALRRTDLRVSLREDRTMLTFAGLTSLRKGVKIALAQLENEIPPALAHFAGDSGVRALAEALRLSLATPRPVEPIQSGQTWQDLRELPALLGGSCRLDRTFSMLSTEQDRSHRFARIEVAAQYRRPDSQANWIAAENLDKEEESLLLLVGSGLPYRIRTGFRCPSSQGMQPFFRVSIDWQD